MRDFVTLVMFFMDALQSACRQWCLRHLVTLLPPHHLQLALWYFRGPAVLRQCRKLMVAIGVDVAQVRIVLVCLFRRFITNDADFFMVSCIARDDGWLLHNR